MLKTIDGGKQVDIQADGLDWVDVQVGVMDPDPNWGRSFKVLELHESYCMVEALVPGTETYAPTGLSYENIVGNFREVPAAE